MVVGEFTTEIDLLVIGAGPGGYVAAVRAAQLGQKVTIVESGKVGGVCLNRGCIPSKALISASHRYASLQGSDDAGSMGIVVEQVALQFDQVQKWKQGVVDKLTGGVEGLLKGNKITILQGEAFFVSQHEVKVVSGYESSRYQFKHCIIATGSKPIQLSSFPFGGRILSSTELLELQELPQRLTVIGGGYIGVELGQTFAKFGTKVSILEQENQILPGFEKQLTQMVVKNLKKSGVEVLTKTKALAVEQSDQEVIITYQGKDGEQNLASDYLLVTVGRTPNTEELGLEAAAISLDKHGFIQVDHQCRTNVPHIFAIGDVVPGPALAHKASYEGKVAAEVIAGQPSAVDYKVIPEIVFTHPEIASVGLNETQAKEEGYQVTVGKFPFGANGRALSINEPDGFVKIVADKETEMVLGAQIVGAEATNLIAELALAIEMAATLEDIALTIHGHPTLGEIVMEAAEVGLGQAIHMLTR